MKLAEPQIDLLKAHWPIDGDIQFHRRVVNYVYFTRVCGADAVLRVTESSHRSKKEIESELDWMSYLAASGMKIASPIATTTGSFVAEMTGDATYFAAMFEKAKGAFLSDDADLEEDNVIEAWGRYVAKMHRLTKAYEPGPGIQPRQQWDQDECFSIALRSVDEYDEVPYRRIHEFREWMRSLPRDEQCYGLVHTDLHRGNFFVDKGEITAFDFDDACHQWFSYDLVAPTDSIRGEKPLESFLSAYLGENDLEQIWIDRIDLFRKYRAVLTYHWAKTFVREQVFDARGLEWARETMPRLLKTFREPLKLF